LAIDIGGKSAMSGVIWNIVIGFVAGSRRADERLRIATRASLSRRRPRAWSRDTLLSLEAGASFRR
jgi:hypothetical protein